MILSLYIVNADVLCLFKFNKFFNQIKEIT